jgi:collagenase-like PrtC family protease
MLYDVRLHMSGALSGRNHNCRPKTQAHRFTYKWLCEEGKWYPVIQKVLYVK